jgi:protein-S-isoprenylcysteine O-methyltransferase Ste14
MTNDALTPRRVLPPRALLLAVAAQLPLLAIARPRFSTAGVLIATALTVAGLAVMIWAERLFQGRQVGVCPFSDAPVLVRNGPYRFTRNPMYVGLVSIDLALIVATGSVANVWSPLALAMWLHYEYVLPEETFLRERFGVLFDSYVHDVPRWLFLRNRSRVTTTSLRPQ